MTQRFVVLGTSRLTLACTQGLLEGGADVKALVSMPASALPDNSVDIEGFARRNGIAYLEAENINTDEARRRIAEYEPEYVFCTWPKMLDEATLAMPSRFCIGTHPTRLPENRGRHPLHWMMVLGMHETVLSFFRVDKGVDSGPILLQPPFEVRPDQTINEAIERMCEAGRQGARALAERLVRDPDMPGMVQDATRANTWRQRTPHDVILDPRLSKAITIGTVRSFVPPYPCARLVFERWVLPVTAAQEADGAVSADLLGRLEPGRVIGVDNASVTLKVADGAVRLTLGAPVPDDLRRARHIHPPTLYFSRHGHQLAEQLW